MAQIPDDFHDYTRPAAAADDMTPRFGNGCFATGFAAAMGGACLAMAYSIVSGAHLHRNEILATYVLLGLGLLFIFTAGRNGIRHFGVANTIGILVISVWPGSCIGFGMFPEGHGHGAAYRASCQNNLKQLGLVCFIYANENTPGLAPQLSNDPGRLMFKNEVEGGLPVYPDILTDLNVLYCPEADNRPDVKHLTTDIAMDDQAYFYLGYTITNQAQLEAFAEAYRATIAAEGNFAGDIESRGVTLHRLVPKLESTSSPKTEGSAPPAEIPLLFERANSHAPGGGNVLYADGHVEFIKTGSKWPMTREAIDVLESLDALSSTAQ